MFSKMLHALKPRITAVRLFSALGVIGVGAAAEHLLSQSRPAIADDAPASQAVESSTPSGLLDFPTLAKKIGPAVVNISTSRLVENAQENDDPMSQFWHHFFGQRTPHGSQKQTSIGSGFVVDPEGTIVTNFHVVDGAEKITVTLSDGKNYNAQVLGKDPKTDIAIIRIKAPQALPVAALGDSDRLEVGEWVMAVGNPFGLDHTVTSGIVSAKGRNIGAGPYDDFIQTNASINPGNSGGPLVNLRGEVIGINTVIFSESGGNIGIGFAIPANLVKEILPQLERNGKVVRGYVGLSLQQVTPAVAELLGVEKTDGALIAGVVKGGPAQRAGIKSGDVITKFDGKVITNSTDLPAQVARTAPGTTAPIELVRDGKRLSVALTVGQVKEEASVLKAEDDELGLAVESVTDDVASELGLDRAEGVVVIAVKPDSSADNAGVEEGDVIVEINQNPVRDLYEYNFELAKIGSGKSVLFRITRGPGSLFLAMKR